MLQVYQQASSVFSISIVGDDRWVASYLVLLLEAIALCTLHLGDVLEEVRHTNRRVQLTRLVRYVNGLPFPQGVSVWLHQAASVTTHVLALICGTQTQGEARVGQDREEGVLHDSLVNSDKLHVGDIMLEAVNVRGIWWQFIDILSWNELSGHCHSSTS